MVLCAVVAALLLAPLPAAAGGFSIFGAYQDTDALDETFGGGVSIAFPLGRVVDLQFRGTYYEKLDDLGNVFDDDEDVFVDNSIEVIPIEAGLRFNLAPRGAVIPYITAGATYFLLDSDIGEIDDEVGYHAGLGLVFGDNEGPAFFVEGLYRGVEGSVEVDPQDIGDIGDIDFEDPFDVDLSGFGANAGISFQF